MDGGGEWGRGSWEAHCIVALHLDLYSVGNQARLVSHPDLFHDWLRGRMAGPRNNILHCSEQG